MMKSLRWLIILAVLFVLVLVGYFWLNWGEEEQSQVQPRVSSSQLTRERADLIELVKNYEPLQKFMANDPKVFTFRVRSIDEKGTAIVDAVRWAGRTAFVYRFYVDSKNLTCKGLYDLYPTDRAFLTVYNSEIFRQFVKDPEDKVVLKLIIPPDEDNPTNFIVSVLDYPDNEVPVTIQFSVDIQNNTVEEVEI